MDTLDELLRSTAVRVPGAATELAEALGELTLAGDRDAADRALAALLAQPAVLPALDAAMRPRYPGTSPRRQVPLAHPLALALASMDPDGRVREAAVVRIEHQLRLSGRNELLPFLLLRTADWVDALHNRARSALALLLLRPSPARLLLALRCTAALGERERAVFARQQLLGALVAQRPVQVIEQALEDADRRVRLLALEGALATRALPLRRLVALAEHDASRQVRTLAAETAVREAVWTEQIELLRRLAASGRPELRVLALTGLMRAGSAAEAAALLDDGSALVRAVAREALRRNGENAAERYRALVSGGAWTPGAVAGLAEVGRSGDAQLLVPLLRHPAAPLRQAAVRALRRLDAVPLAELTPLLRDPSARVVNETVAVLSRQAAQLPAGLAEGLLATPDRAVLRRAGYRLLQRDERRGALGRLRTALAASADPDRRLAARAAADAAGLVHRLVPDPRNRRRPLPFDPDEAERAELLTLGRAAGADFTPRARQLLLELLQPLAQETELLRLRLGPHWHAVQPVLVHARFTAEDARATLERLRAAVAGVIPRSTAEQRGWLWWECHQGGAGTGVVRFGVTQEEAGRAAMARLIEAAGGRVIDVGS